MTAPTMRILTGRCLCGAVRYRAETASELDYYCHCSDCRRYGGAAYHAAIVVAAEDIRIQGALHRHLSIADSGNRIARLSCAACHTHLFTAPSPEEERYSVKAGSLDDPGQFRPAYEIWTQSRVDWAAPEATLTGFDQGFTGERPRWR